MKPRDRTRLCSALSILAFFFCAVGCEARSLRNRLERAEDLAGDAKLAELESIRQSAAQNGKYAILLAVGQELLRDGELERAAKVFLQLRSSNARRAQILEATAQGLEETAKKYIDERGGAVPSGALDLYVAAMAVYSRLIENGQGNEARNRYRRLEISAIVAEAGAKPIVVTERPGSPEQDPETDSGEPPDQPAEPPPVRVTINALPAVARTRPELATTSQGLFRRQLTDHRIVETETELAEKLASLPGALGGNVASYLAARSLLLVYSWQSAQYDLLTRIHGYLQGIGSALSDGGIPAPGCARDPSLGEGIEARRRLLTDSMSDELARARSFHALVLGQSKWELAAGSGDATESISAESRTRSVPPPPSPEAVAEARSYSSFPEGMPAPAIALPVLAGVDAADAPLDRRVKQVLAQASMHQESFAKESEKLKKLVRAMTDVEWQRLVLEERSFLTQGRSSLDRFAASIGDCAEALEQAVGGSRSRIANADAVIEAVRTASGRAVLGTESSPLVEHLGDPDYQQEASRQQMNLTLERMRSDLEIRLAFKRESWTEQKQIESMRELVGLSGGSR